MRNRRNRDDMDETPGEQVGAFIMRQVDAAVDSPEWQDYEITVRCRGRRIVRGFEVKAMSVSNRKIPQTNQQGG
jgi:hypothetical protein